MSSEVEKIAFNVTAFFETGGSNPYSCISSNFDGQGISWGPHQINLGQGTMQPVLRELHEKYSGTLYQVFQEFGNGADPMRDQFLELLGKKTNQDAVDYVDKHWHDVVPGRRSKRLQSNWRSFFEKLGAINETQALIRKQTAWIETKAEILSTWMAKGNKKTVRMYCLAYDIVTQNGGVGRGLRAALTVARPFLKVYRSNYERKGRSMEWAWMSVVAGCRAIQTRITGQTRFMKDVMSRKFLIIDGEDKFRGQLVDLDEKFGVSDAEY